MFIDYLHMIDRPQGHSALAHHRWPSGRTSAGDDATRQECPSDPTDMLARYTWIPNFNIDYYLGVDGISMALILLTTVLFFLSMIASWKIDEVRHAATACCS